MSKKNSIFFFMVFFTLFVSCYYVYDVATYIDFKSDKLYSDGNMKLDGYYSYESISNTIMMNDQKAIRPIILYQDGTAKVFSLYPGYITDQGNYIDSSSFELAYNYFEKQLKKMVLSDGKKYMPFNGWGKWRMDGDTIKIIYYFVGSSGTPLPIGSQWLYEYEGIILNDTTFVLKKDIDYKENKEEIINDLYKFNRFSVKPDSTNWTFRYKDD